MDPHNRGINKYNQAMLDLIQHRKYQNELYKKQQNLIIRSNKIYLLRYFIDRHNNYLKTIPLYTYITN